MSTEISTQNPQDTVVSQEESQKKHKLPTNWNLWLLCSNPKKEKKGKKASNAKCNGLIYNIMTIEDFWAIYNNMVPPTLVFHNNEKSNIVFSREGVEPKWEAEANLGGGVWKCVYKDVPAPQYKTESTNEYKEGNYSFDKFWERLVLSIVGGTFPHVSSVTGIWLKHRFYQCSTIEIEIWCSGDYEEIGKAFYDVLVQSDVENCEDYGVINPKVPEDETFLFEFNRIRKDGSDLEPLSFKILGSGKKTPVSENDGKLVEVPLPQ